MALRTYIAATAITAIVLLTLALTARPAAAEGPPTLLLPWQDGQAWLTGVAGFHGTNDAIDFFPPDTPLSLDVRCEWDPDWVFLESAYWVLASAPGEVVHAGNAYVLVDHGGGWRSRYYHLSAYEVQAGQQVAAGQRLGHPSKLGECSSGPHVHYWVIGPNGETTRNVELSGEPTTSIGVNQYISSTGNYDPAGATPTPTATPEPTPTAEPTVAPTDTPPPPTPEPTPSPEPTEAPLIRGDADCDGFVVTGRDGGAAICVGDAGRRRHEVHKDDGGRGLRRDCDDRGCAAGAGVCFRRGDVGAGCVRRGGGAER